MTSVRQFLRPSCLVPLPPISDHLSEERPFPSLYRRCSLDLALPRGSKRDNRVTMPTRVGKPSSLSLSLFSLFLFRIREPHARVSAVCGVAWCDVASTRLDSRGGGWSMRRHDDASAASHPATSAHPSFSTSSSPSPSPHPPVATSPSRWVGGWVGGRVPTHRAVCYQQHRDRQPPWSSPRFGFERYRDEDVDATCDILRS